MILVKKYRKNKLLFVMAMIILNINKKIINNHQNTIFKKIFAKKSVNNYYLTLYKNLQTKLCKWCQKFIHNYDIRNRNDCVYLCTALSTNF